MKNIFLSFLIFFFDLLAVIPEKVIFCTICRDVGDHLPAFISQVEKIGTFFEDYRVLAYENNSDDDTPSQLYRWKRRNPKVSIEVEFLPILELEKTIINQVDRQFSLNEQRAIARNKALHLAFSRFGEEFAYVIWMDPATQVLALEEIIPTFDRRGEWDAIFAYKKDRQGNFNDWDAFRDSLFPFGPEVLGDAWHTEKHFSLSEDGPWHPVYSAFGGFAIYKRVLLERGEYDGLVGFFLETVVREILSSQFSGESPFVQAYQRQLSSLDTLIYVNRRAPPLSPLPSSYGVYISRHHPLIVWRPYGLFRKFPEVNEHVSFHAALYCRGHRRLFINPRLITVEREKENHCESHPN